MPGLAEDPSGGPSTVKLVSYAGPIEKPATALKWIPCRPAASRADGGVVAADAQAPIDSGRASRDGALDDPFQDAAKGAWPAPVRQTSPAARQVAYSASSAFAEETARCPVAHG